MTSFKLVTAAVLSASLTMQPLTAVAHSTAPAMDADTIAADAVTSSLNTDEIVALSMTALIFIVALAASGGSAAPVVVVSDARLKTDIRKVGTSPDGFAIYQYRYKGRSELVEGVMAQEILQQRPEAVVPHDSGYLMVDYSRLDVVPRIIN